MDWLDFVFKFSGELLVLLLAGTIVAGNFYFFMGRSSQHALNDQSLLAVLLKKHPDKNNALFVKTSSIITTVANAGGLFTQAHADDFAGLSSDNQAADPAAQTDSTDPLTQINSDGIVKPNPDSLDAFKARQIKIYETKSGDSLKSIAATNGISEQTIIWANSLPNTTIKPGWQLIILPTDGIIHKMTSQDTLPDLANKYSGNLDTIISYNALKDAEDFDVNDLIIIPGGTMPEPPKPKPTPKPAQKPTKAGGKISGPDSTPEPVAYLGGDNHIFPQGYCTYYVASKVKVTWGGNAKSWLGNARASGYLVNSNPSAGAIVVTNESRKYGHVAYVERVTDNSIIVSEMNYSGFNRVDTREIPIGSSVIKGYIHP